MTTALMVLGACLLALSVVVLVPVRADAHCDTMDGPAVRDGRRALETGDPGHALKWVGAEHAEELREIFGLARTARVQGGAAREVADRWFLENLVRVHRAGEGAPYTGLKPSGTPVDEKVVAADRCVDSGTLDPLVDLVPTDLLPELEERLAEVLRRRHFDVDDLEAGRAYVEAYVGFVKLAEGEEHDHRRARSAHRH
ncbi:LysM domain-containing protein [Kocuria sediminis]|uniref:LysM domain-containing protein n=1 Tax=Kocuria sediminis TaxID=1038857 RepID=A0A6N8GKP1_9MICC|nr:DUF6448 family protein [Kocuria sediminis]MUN62820.1 LysM domain-containing protein [Kocuria sediminis]